MDDREKHSISLFFLEVLKMNLHIRNIDPYAVKKFGELEQRSGVSRHVYLKGTLESLAMLEVLTN